MRPWQRGIPLDELAAVTRPFAEHDEGLILGAFGRVNEARAAEWIDARRLLMPQPGVAAACRVLERPLVVRDFRRQAVVELPASTALVERLGYEAGAEDEALRLLAELGSGLPLACWLWQEHEGDRRLAQRLGLRLLAVKIRASSEILGLWGDPRIEPSPLPPLERLGLARLALPSLDVGPLREAVDARVGEWAAHYSSYNERGSWSALALRGFGGTPAWIEKPAEMARRWRADHPERFLPCADTPLRAQLPEAEPIIAAIPGPKERIRLMRLAPGGGLSRHADITDRDAGASEGRLLRIHVPIRSDAGVRFCSWDPLGEASEASMAEGEAWFLDTRKPHACRSESAAERIHLVMDSWATPELLALLAS